MATAPAADIAARYHRLKTDIHRRVVETLDLSRLGKWEPARLRIRWPRRLLQERSP